jgi:uncharacterized protein (TIGR02594 family)
MPQAEPVWLAEARKDIGQRETLGPNDSPWIRAMLDKLGARWLLGQPWCGGAVAKWAQDAGLSIPKNWYRARAWASWGQHMTYPAHGCIVVFARKGGGHVGILTGETTNGDLLVLGGNQGDAVNIRAFLGLVSLHTAGRPAVNYRGNSSLPKASQPRPRAKRDRQAASRCRTRRLAAGRGADMAPDGRGPAPGRASTSPGSRFPIRAHHTDRGRQ